MSGLARAVRLMAPCLTLLVAVSVTVSAGTTGASAATAAALTRSPYLTDATQTSMTINWATDTTGTTGSVAWGPVGDCTANTTAATKTNITVISKAEYQWKATIPVTPDTQYCYRVKLGSTDLLGTDPTPQFTSQIKAGSTAPYSFAVFGDWGQAYTGGVNADQTNVLKQISQSGARFAVMTGDTAYPGGGQKEYGDLQQAGVDQSTVFGPTFWGVPGKSIPLFNVTGNHGFTNGSVQVTNFPEQNTAAASNGKYAMETYPSINGSTSKSYPSMWYAFDAGPARYYILTAAWGDSNIGTGSVYQNDRDAHWTPSSPEYQWLENDLQQHPNALKFAFWHYPLYADSSSQPSDTFLQGGPGTLQGLLDSNNVAMAFNGHAHGYQRNKADSAGLVTHVVGNGGAALGSVSGCSAFDLYAIGRNGTHCGSAPATTPDAEVYGFVKVTVNGRTVTVTPTSSTGRTYDVQTYTFPGSEPDATPPTPPTVQANVVSTSRIDVSWSGASDNVGVTGYQLYRTEGTGTPLLLTEQTGTAFSDTTASPSTDYTYSVYALDAAGNRSTAGTTPASTTGAPDGTAPSQPGNLTATASSSSVVNLSWTASTDNIGVVGYNVYRNGTLISQPITTPDPNPSTTYNDETAQPSTTYTYSVSAVDAAGNESTKASKSVTTPPASGGGGTFTFAPTDDAYVTSTNPTATSGAAARLTVDNSPATNTVLKFTVAGLPTGCSVTSARLQLTVGDSIDDKSPYGGDLYGSADNNWTQGTVTWNTQPAAAATKTSSVATAVALSTAYTWNATSLVTGNGTVTMVVKSTSSDGARYYSTEGGSAAQDPVLTVVCGSGGGTTDTTPPSTPPNLTATAASSTQVNLAWEASTDNVGVTGYQVTRNGGTPVTVAGTARSFTDTGLTASTTYNYSVVAVDAAGNRSPAATASATTPAAAGGGTFTFSPTDDAYVDSSAPTTNFGTNARLTADNSPKTNALLKFNVTGLPAGCAVSSAKLQLTVGSGSTDTSPYGGDLYGASNTSWTQSTVNWNTQPAAAATKTSSVATTVALRTAYTWDVKPLVTGSGPVTMVVKSTSGDGARYYSTEGGTAAQDPVLTVVCG